MISPIVNIKFHVPRIDLHESLRFEFTTFELPPLMVTIQLHLVKPEHQEAFDTFIKALQS